MGDLCARGILPSLLLFCFTAAAADEPGWIEISNGHSKLVLESLARFSPETAASLGVEGYDEEIMDLRIELYERTLTESRRLLEELNERLDAADHPKVRQDLGILIKAVEDSTTSAKLEREHLLPYYNLSQQVFGGVRALIDDQVPAERYPAAVVRIRRYAGLEEDYTPITELAKARTAERFGVEGLTGPYRGEVEQDLERSETFITGIENLLAGTELEGWQEAYDTLAAQLRDYNEWVRAEILPRARDDYRMPPELYANALVNYGVDATPEELIRVGTQGYMAIRSEMEALAPLVAEARGYESSDYRDVIRNLKREGAIDGDELLDQYRQVLGKIEDIIREQELVTLPERPAGIRIATAAETAASPAPHLDIPRMVGNTGEYPEFVIPKLERNEDGTWQQTDDTYASGTWTLTAHEARPGHELQFSSMLETGVSIARAIFAFNSANVEGWGLYAEAITKPYMPLDAQLVSLQNRLMRAARMFLDPMLNLGMITPEQAKALLIEDVAIGESWAKNEVERYTYRMPGQACAYYFGFLNLQGLRTQTELELRDRFDQQEYHDFLLAQGLLPPEILRQAVMEEFVPSQQRTRNPPPAL